MFAATADGKKGVAAGAGAAAAGVCRGGPSEPEGVADRADLVEVPLPFGAIFGAAVLRLAPPSFPPAIEKM